MKVETIEKLRTFKDEVSQQLSHRGIEKFTLNDLRFDGNNVILQNGVQLNQPALKKICRSMRVYPAFLKYSEKMNETDWIDIQNKLKNVNSTLHFWGQRTDYESHSSIKKVFARDEVPELAENFNELFNNYFDMIITATEGSSKDFEIEKIDFNTENEEISLVMSDPTSVFPVYKNDNWNRGVSIKFDQMKFAGFPFYGRLICQNGLIDGTKGLITTIQSKRFNINKIQQNVNRLLINGSWKEDTMIISAVEHLKNNQLSVREFLEYRNKFVSWNQDEQYNHILHTTFDVNKINKTYGDLTDKSERWLSSANSGRNAYEFFNDMIRMTTHTNKSKIETDHAQEIQKMSANLLFKDVLDLEDRAPVLDVYIKPTFEDSFIQK